MSIGRENVTEEEEFNVLAIEKWENILAIVHHLEIVTLEAHNESIEEVFDQYKHRLRMSWRVIDTKDDMKWPILLFSAS